MKLKESPWWRGAAIYQVYIRSFCDSNGDGQGDLAGITSRLDYIHSLGVDGIWLSPIHPSPNRDWGYDVCDYNGIHPDYGTLADFTQLLESAHARGLKVILDAVLAHTSDEHPWFTASRDGDLEKRDWYVWAAPQDDGTVPNNWLSVFGGPAWAYQPTRFQYYHHKFLRQQPKLNWMNDGAREAALAVLDCWLQRGVDGFRLDVANAFLHDPDLIDNPGIPPVERGSVEWAAAANMQRHFYDSNLEKNKDILNMIRRRIERFDDRFVFGEFSEEFERSGCYLPSNEGLHAGYNFALLVATDMAAIRAHLQTLDRFPDHWPCVAFSNHDVTRTASRFGPRAAKALLALLVTLRGTVLLYQGEELGLSEVDLRRDQLRDPVGDLYYPAFKGRDGCRTPMPWDAKKSHFGFSSGEPWLPLGKDHGPLAVSEQEEDSESVLSFTRKLFQLRRSHRALRLGTLKLLPGPGLSFLREWGADTICCAFNLSDGPLNIDVPGEAGTLLETHVTEHSRDSVRLGPFSAWIGMV